MDASILTGTPFAALTAMVAPAILTNACSVLALGTSNRLARVVDRTRIVTGKMASLTTGTPEFDAWLGQRRRLEVRAQLLLEALRRFYASLAAFASAALLLVISSVLALCERPLALRVVGVAALAAGVFAVAGLVLGCMVMVRETRLAVQTLVEGANLQTP